MKPGDIYREAAARITDGRDLFACTALDAAARHAGESVDEREYLLTALARYFRPERESAIWFGRSANPKNQNARVLALLFMAEIADEEQI